MQCEIRKSCNLRNIVYEIGKLASPAAVIVIDIARTSGVKRPAVTMYRKFWYEMVAVYREVWQANRYNLKDSVWEYKRANLLKSPMMVDFEVETTRDLVNHGEIVDQLHDLGFKRIATVCLINDEDEIDGIMESIHSLKLRDETAFNGTDMLAIVYYDESDIS